MSHILLIKLRNTDCKTCLVKGLLRLRESYETSRWYSKHWIKQIKNKHLVVCGLHSIFWMCGKIVVIFNQLHTKMIIIDKVNIFIIFQSTTNINIFLDCCNPLLKASVGMVTLEPLKFVVAQFSWNLWVALSHESKSSTKTILLLKQ